MINSLDAMDSVHEGLLEHLLSVQKASFGGDRSAAGRYAAEQRWKGHVKQDDGGRDTVEKLTKDATKLKADFDALYSGERLGLKQGKPLTQKEWKTWDGTELYVVVEINGLKQTVPSVKLLRIEQRVCKIGERARAIALEKLGNRGDSQQPHTETELELARTQAYVEVMKEMGIKIGGDLRLLGNKTTAQSKFVKDVVEIFPSNAIEAVNQNFPAMRVKKTSDFGGGVWLRHQQVIETSGTRDTNIHEFTHAVTDAVPIARVMENVFLQRRRMGDPARTREQYDVTERITKLEPYAEQGGDYIGSSFVRDHLSDPYAGRKYGIGFNGPTESLTRGMEYLFADRYSSNDEDHKNLAMGTLIMIGLA